MHMRATRTRSPHTLAHPTHSLSAHTRSPPHTLPHYLTHFPTTSHTATYTLTPHSPPRATRFVTSRAPTGPSARATWSYKTTSTSEPARVTPGRMFPVPCICSRVTFLSLCAGCRYDLQFNAAVYSASATGPPLPPEVLLALCPHVALALCPHVARALATHSMESIASDDRVTAAPTSAWTPFECSLRAIAFVCAFPCALSHSLICSVS